MDIMELSRKMEGDLLESHSTNSSEESLSNNSSHFRITRSQANTPKKTLVQYEQPDVSIKKTNSKKGQIEMINLNKKPKIIHKNLETIYENPLSKKGCTVFLGKAKIKRSIYLDGEFRITNKQKSRMRKMKIKKLGIKIKPCRISDEEFSSKMSAIEKFINSLSAFDD